jgi:hypothetical protein
MPRASAETTATAPHRPWWRRSRGASAPASSVGRAGDLRARWGAVWWTLGPDSGQAICAPPMLLNSVALATCAGAAQTSASASEGDRYREHEVGVSLTTKHHRPVRGAHASKLRMHPHTHKIASKRRKLRHFAHLMPLAAPSFGGRAKGLRMHAPTGMNHAGQSMRRNSSTSSLNRSGCFMLAACPQSSMTLAELSRSVPPAATTAA